MKNNNYDVIIIGAGSVGVPTAFYLGQTGLSVLVLDSHPSIGQGSNKAAIGGIRATHSDRSKAWLCQRSLDIFSTWKDKQGDDIEWKKGGYVYAVYREQDERDLKDILELQHSWGMNIHWLDPKHLLQVVPDLNPVDLRGGTYSPDDGHTSPLLSLYAFYQASQRHQVTFHFNEPVIDLIQDGKRVIGVRTEKGNYYSQYVINAAGAWAQSIAAMANVDLPVVPESHEAAITEPVQIFLDPLVVDIRPWKDTSNFYFYQHSTGQVIFCYSPEPPITGLDTRVTSSFLPTAARRLVNLIPRLKNIRVRRTWRGLYPMTPDGSPLLGFVDETPGLILTAGMCGQGFMLGPGVAELITDLVTDNLDDERSTILRNLSLSRQISTIEMLK